ncbi:MAG: uroporphyrinogen-III C-methyltransferase [Firmicutes bacterium]|nr:uroporphyrinogen-III C-methyltransferase [Bacillota bacterium]
MHSQAGTVYLIGAGPGDHKLITLRGAECLKQSEVVVYDRLVNPRLLALAPPQAEMIYVGKDSNRHVLSQDGINRLLVGKAREGKTVARLKGGDPFVFGRGGEEAEELREAGIPFEVVPGITSAIAVPAYAGIPVTHRQYSSTLTLVTGHEDPFKPDSSIAWDSLAGLGGTLVFLMGLENLPEITRRLMAEGLAGDTPVGLVQWGTFAEQRVITGRLGDIVSRAKESGLTPPVVTVVGDVVKLRETLKWRETKPLFGRRILVTRAREQASALSKKLESLGAEVWEYPAIEIAPLEDYALIDQKIDEIENYRWIIFTSANGVQAFFARLWEKGKDVRSLQSASLAAIGPGTSQALAERGLRAEFVPSEFRAEAIAEGLKGRVDPGDRVLLPRARGARTVLPETLSGMGAEVDDVVVYETLVSSSDPDRLKQMMRDHPVDMVTFTSSSTVSNFMQLIGERPEKVSGLEKAVMACIGPITAATAEGLGLKVGLVASEYTIEGLVDQISRYYNEEKEGGRDR